jgi:hypothetical protein
LNLSGQTQESYPCVLLLKTEDAGLPPFAGLIREKLSQIEWTSPNVSLPLRLLQNLSQEPQVPVNGCRFHHALPFEQSNRQPSEVNPPNQAWAETRFPVRWCKRLLSTVACADVEPARY